MSFIFISVLSCSREPVPGENEFRDSRDAIIYKTVQFGDKIWMAENLRYLPSIDSSHLESETEPSYYIYDYKDPKLSIAIRTTNYFTYGVLYNWPGAMSACPEGWHLPSDYEWKDLEIFMGMDPDEVYDLGYRQSGAVGDKIRSAYDWQGSGYGIDEPGFNAKGGGRRSAYSGNFLNYGTHAFFWTSTKSSNSNAILRYIELDSIGVYRSEGSMRNAYSVRCVRD